MQTCNFTLMLIFFQDYFLVIIYNVHLSLHNFIKYTEHFKHALIIIYYETKIMVIIII